MSRSQNQGAGPGRDPDAPLRRDAALARVRRTRRWVVGTSAALTAGFAVLVAESAPGHSATAASSQGSSAQPVSVTSSSSGSSSSTSSSASATSSGDQGLSTPAQAPSSRDSSSGDDAPVSGGS
jgi:hypothetical protein